ncbi:hypothetical protein [Terrisporobacter sp.]
MLAEIDTSTIKLAQRSIEKLNTDISSANISLEETKNSYDSQIGSGYNKSYWSSSK